ncbi:hypothetical protein NC651_031025 [Populus alba x Populus x berolinensis]|nr:hypothetical protein NC651_031025 [Populus alba x Populus x berolinensis]
MQLIWSGKDEPAPGSEGITIGCPVLMPTCLRYKRIWEVRVPCDCNMVLEENSEISTSNLGLGSPIQSEMEKTHIYGGILGIKKLSSALDQREGASSPSVPFDRCVSALRDRTPPSMTALERSNRHLHGSPTHVVNGAMSSLGYSLPKAEPTPKLTSSVSQLHLTPGVSLYCSLTLTEFGQVSKSPLATKRLKIATKKDAFSAFPLLNVLHWIFVLDSY